MAAIDQLGFYNGALLLLKEEALANLSENREPRYKLDQLWNEGAGGGSSIINACLGKAEWVFAKRSVRLDYNNGITTSFAYKYACDRPTDYVRLISLSSDEYHQNQLNAYEETNAYFISDFQTLFLKYVSNDTSYGSNLAAMPQVFIEYMKAYMASKIAGKLTGSKVDADEMRKEKARCLSQAMGENAVEKPAAFPTQGSWVQARHGPRGFYPIRGR